MPPPLRSPTVVHPLPSLAHHFRISLVGCCVQSTNGGPLKPRRISLFHFYAPKSDGRKDATASSPIVIVVRAVSPEYNPTIRPLFGWLLRRPVQQEPSKSEAPSPPQFSFYYLLISSLKRRVNILPHASRLCESPLQCPPPRRHHRLVGCCIYPLSNGHPRPVLRPSLNFSMGAISAP